MHVYVILYFAGMTISGYQIVPNPMSSVDISQSASSCHSKSALSVVTLDDFISKPLSGVELIAPSKCDSEYIDKHNLCFN